MEVVSDTDEAAVTVAPTDLFDPALVCRQASNQAGLICKDQTLIGDPTAQLGDSLGVLLLERKRPSNTPVSGLVFVMNSSHERCWSVGWSS
jgi:hypothetical protein